MTTIRNNLLSQISDSVTSQISNVVWPVYPVKARIVATIRHAVEI